jgi:hypothetical protein
MDFNKLSNYPPTQWGLLDHFYTNIGS